MKEILGKDLTLAFNYFNISAVLKYVNESYEVWALSDKEFEKLCNIKEEYWTEDFGWWRYGHCIFEGRELYEYYVNGYKMLGYFDEEMLKDINEGEAEEDKISIYAFAGQDYDTFTDWLSEVFDLSTEKNIACFAISLAEENGMTLAEFMKMYQPY